MIPVTERMLRIHAELWRLTESGTKPWTGVLKLDGITAPSIADALYALKDRDIISWQRAAGQNHNVRVFRVHVGPEALEIGILEPGRKGGAIRNLDACNAAFAEALEKAHPGEQFDSVTLKPSPVYVPMVAGAWAL